MTVTLQHFGGVIEDVPDEMADALLRGGAYVWILGRRPETAMLAASENAMLPSAAPRVIREKKKPKKGRKR